MCRTWNTYVEDQRRKHNFELDANGQGDIDEDENKYNDAKSLKLWMITKLNK